VDIAIAIALTTRFDQTRSQPRGGSPSLGRSFGLADTGR
jgi:hypothetical protein